MSISLEALEERWRGWEAGHGKRGWAPAEGAEREAIPFGWIQWKGTDVCMDVHCACGAFLHIDASFAYYIRCPHCDQLYRCGEFVQLVPVEALPPGVTAVVEPYPDEDVEDE